MRLVRTLVSMLLLAAPAAAQGVTKDAPARTGEEQAVLAVVNRLFDAMRAGDSAAVCAVVHPNGTLFRLAERDGAPTLGTDSIGAFVRAVGRPHAEVWDERTANERVFVDGPLAMVWADYWFFAGSTFSHCGVDAFQLYKGAKGWQIASIADTRRREGCAPAPARRP